MSRLLVLGIALLGSGCGATSAAAPASPEHPARALVAKLPYVGTVYSRSSCHGAEESLGVLADPQGQSGEVMLRTSSLARNRELQPGSPVTWFRCLPAHVQWLAAAAGGEDGLVIGAVRVDFGPASPEEAYSPPRTTVEVYPRRPWGFYGTASVQKLLRRLTR